MYRQIRCGNPAGRAAGGVAIAVLCALLAARGEAQPTLSDPDLAVQLVANGLDTPTTMAFVGPGDILVLQKNDGRVRRVLGGVLQPDAVLDVAVDPANERGLLGIAVN